MPRQKRRTWVVVADGARARYLSSDDRGASFATLSDQVSAAHGKPTRALGADKPGRGRSSGSGARYALTPKADWHSAEEEAFARAVAQDLNAAAQRRDFDELVLIAPAKTLGEIRANLDAETHGRTVAAISKDLTNLPEPDLHAAIRRNVEVW